MSNNLDITINDFGNICRTCLSSEDLTSLYQKYAEMLLACTVVKFAENDDLPAKICTNCIDELNNAFSFAKRCETTDKILRKCVIKLETEVTNHSSYSQNVEPVIKTEEIYLTVKEVLSDYEHMEEVTQEKDVKKEFEENWMNVEGDMKIGIKCDEIYDRLVGENAEEDNDEIQNETFSDNPDNSGSRHKTINCHINDDEVIKNFDNYSSMPTRSCTISQIEKNSSKDDDSETYYDSTDESYEEEDTSDQGETYLENPDNPGSMLKHKTANPQQIKGGSTENKMSQHKHDLYSQSSNQCQKGIHTGMKPHICEVCNKGFNKNFKLITHMRKHTGEKPYTCEICSKKFACSVNLKRHYMRIHTREKPYACDVCSKTFTDSSNIKRHMRIHIGEKPYICEVCSKGFRHNDSLKEHMRLHTGEKPYICAVCSRAFPRSPSLKRHMRMHTGETPYTCEICSKSFSRNGDLKCHMRIHIGEKPYTCKVCSKAFTQSSHLQTHMRIHTGEKIHICEVCSKAFNQSSILNRHKRIHAKV